MAKVYRHAFINLTATAAPSAEHSMIRSRDRRNAAPCIVDLRWGEGMQGPHRCHSIEPFTRYVNVSPVRRRAWTFQERFLSSRTVNFAADQLYWNCLELNAAETDPRGEHLIYGSEGSKKNAMIRSLLSHGSFTEHNFEEFWTNCVGEYTAGNLTNQCDKLVALSGCADLLQRPGNDYLAGIWSSALPQGLLWCSEGSQNTKSNDYVAPSWSWASFHGQVGHYEEISNSITLTSAIDVVSAKTILLSIQHPYGSVLGGHIRIRGPLLEASLSRSHIRHGYSLSLSRHEVDPVYSFANMDVYQEHSIGERVFVLVLLQEKKPRNVRQEASQRLLTMAGLVLEPIRLSKGQFRRTGIFMVYRFVRYSDIKNYLRRRRVDHIHDRAWSLLRGFRFHETVQEAIDARSIKEQYYEEFDGDKYTINIT
jgi:hypothetical protein